MLEGNDAQVPAGAGGVHEEGEGGDAERFLVRRAVRLLEGVRRVLAPAAEVGEARAAGREVPAAGGRPADEAQRQRGLDVPADFALLDARAVPVGQGLVRVFVGDEVWNKERHTV